MINQSTGYRLSAQQEQRWSVGGGSDPGRVSLLAQIGATRQAYLLASLAASTARHAILRTEFVQPRPGRQPLQVVAEAIADTPVSGAVQLEMWSTNENDLVRVRLTASSLNADIETLRLLLREIAGASPESQEAGTQTPGFQYLNISEWQHELLSQSEAAELLDWWRAEVDGVLPQTLGITRQWRSGPLKKVPFVCPREVAAAARERAGDADISDVVLGTWLITQSLFTGHNHQSVACRFDGRFSPELKEVLGPLSRFLPLTVRWSGDETLQGCVASARIAREERADRQEYFYPPAIERDDPVLTGRLPGYAFAERASRFRIRNAEVVIIEEEEPLPVSGTWALQCVSDGRTLKGWLHYDASVLSEQVAISMRDTFLHYLASYAGNPQQRIRCLRPLSEAAQRQILNSLPDAGDAEDHARATLIPARILESARRVPLQTAVIDGGRRLSYEELWARAGELAVKLHHLGVGPEDPVGILMHGSAEAVISMLAVLLAGSTYVPLTPSDPPGRIEGMINSLKISVVVVADPVLAERAHPDARAVRVDLKAPVPREPALSLPPISPDHGAYIIHTSGSTGEARAVLVPHGTLLESTRARQRYYQAPVERFLLASPLIFDSSIAGLFWTLVDGGTLIIPREVPVNAEELRQLITEHGVTHLLCIPRLLQTIAEGAAPGDLGSLRTAIVAGESCQYEVAATFSAVAPGCTLYNEYGVTEAGVWSTVHRVTPDDTKVVPIGAAIPGARVYVCGEELDLVPVGAVGEFCVGGQMLARGCVGRPGETAARFLPDPYATRPGARLYRTGDRVRSLDGQTLAFLGRLDHQVKIRGQRVELEQLETIIRQNLSVAEVAAVVDRRTSSAGLAVFYTTGPGDEVTPEQVRSTLTARLPGGIVPAHIARIDALPRTATGKLDRQRLAESIQSASARTAASPPQTPLEWKLAEIWAPLLGVAEIGRDDNFFALGGDSIIGLQITARARSAGLAMTPQQVLSCRTIAALAAEIEEGLPAEMATAVVSNTLTPIQRWFFTQDFTDPHHYNQALMADATSELNLDALRQALRSIVSAHAALQTGFVRDAEGWRARYDSEVDEVSVRRLDLAPFDPFDQGRAMHEALVETQTSFDLARPPLMRVLVIDRGTTYPVRVVLVAHHLIIDGVSWRILLDDLATAYDAVARGESPAIARESATPGQWGDLLARLAQESSVRAPASYWLEDLSDPQIWTLPIDYPDGSNLESNAASIKFALRPELTRRLTRTDGEGIVDALLLSALGRALADWRGHHTIWIALELHGRDTARQGLDLSRTIGWFTTVAPLRLACRRSLTTADLAADVQRQLQRLPADAWLFDYLRFCETGAESSRLTALPRPPVSFNNLGTVRTAAIPKLPLTFRPETCGPLRSPQAHRPHLIDVTISTVDDALAIVITYSRTLHAARTIERVGERMIEALEEICAAAV